MCGLWWRRDSAARWAWGADSSQTTPIADGAIEGAAAPPLQPVSAPERVFLVGRLKNPAKVADTVESWGTLPMPWRDGLRRGLPGADKVIDLNAPIDVVVSMDDGGAMQEPEFRAVFSVGLTSLDDALRFAKEQGERAERVAPGVYRVDSDCVVARSLGQAPRAWYVVMAESRSVRCSTSRLEVCRPKTWARRTSASRFEPSRFASATPRTSRSSGAWRCRLSARNCKVASSPSIAR